VVFDAEFFLSKSALPVLCEQHQQQQQISSNDLMPNPQEQGSGLMAPTVHHSSADDVGVPQEYADQLATMRKGQADC